MSYKNLLTLIFVAVTFILSSCWSDKGKNIPDVSNIKVDVEMANFNENLFSIDTNDVKSGIIKLKEEFPAFFDIYMVNVLQASSTPELNDELANNVKLFLTDPFVQNLADTTNVVYGNFKNYKKGFEKAFQFYKHYFPSKSVPKIYPYISGFNYSGFTFETDQKEDALGIGLDLFLGNDYPYWKYGASNPAFSNYLTRTWTPDYLIKKSMDAVINDLVPMTRGDRLLDLMIYNGKKMFVLDQLLPNTPDSIKWEYTSAQSNWVKTNEEQMWRHFLESELLYETQINKIKKLVDQSPSSPGMPQEAPGRTANYIGMQIIKSFMKQNPNFTLEQLISLDAQKIFDQANYKPRNRS